MKRGALSCAVRCRRIRRGPDADRKNHYGGGFCSRWAGSAQAADLPSVAAPRAPAPVFTTWEFSVTGYAWASGLNGTLATVPPLPAIGVDLTFVDILKNLGGALMGTFEAKYGRFILFNDLMYTRLVPDITRAKGPIGLTVSIDAYSFIGLAAAGYRVVEGPQFTLDVFGGVRGFYMDNSISVRVAAGHSRLATPSPTRSLARRDRRHPRPLPTE